MALLDKVKTACRVTSEAYDDELTDLIASALDDLGLTDILPSVLVDDDSTISPLIRKAVITYCRFSFGRVPVETYDRIKASYDEQKAQLLMASGYTDWGVTDA